MRVIFLCTANSCRSQMAEAWARALFPDGWEAASAGLLTYPITDDTRNAMADVGLDMDGQFSKPVEAVDLDSYDLVVTLSRQSTQFLPRLKDPSRHRPHPMSDPMSARGTPAEIRAAFARGRDRIGQLVETLVRDHGGQPKILPRRS
ncbi:MAG TPA: arsenate reductase ArsC [Candidatus Krumholzibacteria bacterium]|nr:arsenate reductase ArsC [Candidatus Krumholzibacteria bacterium]HRX50550.1 arsenate reductase ArsC [Candidatus Krumholzibacteria bacterium]